MQLGHTGKDTGGIHRICFNQYIVLGRYPQRDTQQTVYIPQITTLRIIQFGNVVLYFILQA